MNGIFSITVDYTINHDTHAKSVQQLVLKMRINEKKIGLNIING